MKGNKSSNKKSKGTRKRRAPLINPLGQYMKRIGCSNITIALIIVGILPLIGGSIGIIKVISHLNSGLNYSWLIQSIFLFSFGLLTCGFRSCLYLTDNSFVFNRSILFFKLKNRTMLYSDFNKILIDMNTTVTTADAWDEPTYYNAILVGNIESIDISDYLRFQRHVLKKKSWPNILNLADKLATYTKLDVEYSDKVRSYNSLN